MNPIADIDNKPAGRPVAAKWITLALAVSVPVVAAAMWALRRNELRTGLPCDARGTWGCTYDETLAAVYGAVVGLFFLVVALLGLALSNRFRRAGVAMTAASAAVWAVIAAVLIVATMS